MWSCVSTWGRQWSRWGITRTCPYSTGLTLIITTCRPLRCLLELTALTAASVLWYMQTHTQTHTLSWSISSLHVQTDRHIDRHTDTEKQHTWAEQATITSNLRATVIRQCSVIITSQLVSLCSVVLAAGTQLKQNLVSFDSCKVELCGIKRSTKWLDILWCATIECPLTV